MPTSAPPKPASRRTWRTIRMRSAAGERDIRVVGGGNVASQFADHGWVDRVEVTIVPVVLGNG